MAKGISFGQFYPGKSFLHRMDPRVKILLAIAYIVTVFLCQTFFSYLAIFLFLISLVLIAQVPVKSVLRSIKGILFLVILTAAINILFFKEGRVLADFWVITITLDGLIFSAKMAMRLIFLVI